MAAARLLLLLTLTGFCIAQPNNRPQCPPCDKENDPLRGPKADMFRSHHREGLPRREKASLKRIFTKPGTKYELSATAGQPIFLTCTLKFLWLKDFMYWTATTSGLKAQKLPGHYTLRVRDSFATEETVFTDEHYTETNRTFLTTFVQNQARPEDEGDWYLTSVKPTTGQTFKHCTWSLAVSTATAPSSVPFTKIIVQPDNSLALGTYLAKNFERTDLVQLIGTDAPHRLLAEKQPGNRFFETSFGITEKRYFAEASDGFALTFTIPDVSLIPQGNYSLQKNGEPIAQYLITFTQ